MTHTANPALILQDETGARFAVPLDFIEQCRIPDAAAAQMSNADDVNGYLLPAILPVLGVAPGPANPARIVSAAGGAGSGGVVSRPFVIYRVIDEASV